MTADQCPDERPLLCSDSKCYSQAEVCRGLLQHCDDMFYDYCRAYPSFNQYFKLTRKLLIIETDMKHIITGM